MYVILLNMWKYIWLHVVTSENIITLPVGLSNGLFMPNTPIPVAKPCPASAWIPLATTWALASPDKTWRLLQAAHLNCHSSEYLLPRTLAVKRFGFTISQRSQSGI